MNKLSLKVLLLISLIPQVKCLKVQNKHGSLLQKKKKIKFHWSVIDMPLIKQTLK